MRLVMATLAGMILLTGCAEVRYAGNHAQETTVREAQLSQDKLKYILDPNRRLVKEPPQPIKPAYCYKNFGDVVCYKDPLPNARSRMIGYQEPLVRAPETPDANGFEPVEYKDGDRSKIFNPYRNESGIVDAYVSGGQSGNSSSGASTSSAKTSSYLGKSAPQGRELYTVQGSAPVKVDSPTPVREFDMVEDKPLVCPEACKKSAQKSVKKTVKAKSKPAKGKKAVKAKAKKAAKKKVAAKESVKSEAAAAATSTTATAPAVAPAPAEAATAPAAPAASPAAVPAKPAAPQETLPKVDSPKANLRKLEEIKYDPKVADPKSLIKDKK